MPASDYQQSLDAQYENDLRESRRQQDEAAREATRQQKEQAQQQQDALKEQQRVANNKKEATFRAQKRPQYVDAYGDIQPTHTDEEWQQQQETALANAAAHDEAARSGRKFTTSKVTGAPIYQESEQAVEARRKAAAEDLRRTSLDKQLKANQAEFEYQKQSGGLAKPLTDRQKKKLADEHQAARFGLAGALDAKTKEVTGGNDYIPWNEAPSADALKAKERQARLTAPDTAQLSEDDLAEFDANDATKPLAAKIRNIQGLLSKDASTRQLQQKHAQRQADLVLRRDAPDKWESLQKHKLATMSPDELQEAYAPLAARQQETEAQLAALTAENKQRRKEGIPAGELVSFEGEGGQPDHWAKDLAAKRETLLAQHQQAQQDAAPVLDELQTQHAALQKDIELHNEGAQLLQAGQTTAAAEQKQADLSHLKFTPGHEQTAQEIEALDSEAQTRLADLNTVWEGNPPPEAVQAIQQDVAQRSQAALAMGDSRRLAAQSAYAGIQQQLQEYQANPQKKGDVGDLWINARKNLSEALQIPESKAMQLLEDVEAEHDWDKVLGRFHESTPSGEWKSWRNATADDSDPRQTRVLSNGGIVVNPSITDEAKYKAAVESAKASPEAKAAALARYPQIRQRQGQNVLDTLKEIEGTFGKETLKPWEAFSKQRPKDVSEQDWALKFSEKLKADTAASPWTSLLKQVTRSGAQGLYDLRQQGSGFIAGLTGSQTAMQDAQWAGRKAAALGATKELEGTVGQNFASRGVLDQLPRLAGSILPAAGGAKAAQLGIRLFAATSLGARLLPSLAAAMESAATPAQAVKAVQTLTRVGLGGTATAAGIQTYGSQLADIYGTLRREDPSLTHQQALSAAQQPAILSAAVTALLTTAGGAHGLEKLLVNPAGAKELFKKQFTSQLQRAGFLGAAFAKGAGKELIEELPDELFSQWQSAVASHPKDAQAGTKAIAQFMKQLPELSVAIGLLGGAGEAISDAQGTSIQHSASSHPASLPETQAAAEAAIQNHRHLDANGVEVPEFTAATQQRAALALATARGGDLFDATEKQLNAAGWTRRDSQGRDMPPGKYARLKDYTGPNVLNIDTTGRAHIDPQYLTSLKETLPAVAAAIPDEATKPATVNEPTSVADTSTTKSGSPAAGQAPAHGVGANANQNPIPAPDQPGSQPPPSGSPPAQSGTPVTSENSANSVNPVQNSGSGSTSTRVPTTEQSIADWLVDRHMPDAEAAAAAKAITSHPDMAGKDYDHFTRQITARDQVLQSLGITGSTSKSQAAANPLRFPHNGTVARTSSSDSGPSENSDNSVNPVQNSGSGSSKPTLPASVQSALDDTIPGTPSPEVFTAVKKAVQAKEMTEQQATEIVAQQSGAQDHTALRQSLENNLGWNPTRANTAAALHFGDKTKSDIPLAAAERDSASNRVPSNATAATISGTKGPEPELASAPSALTQNDDYARAKLTTLSRIKDPTKKSWARQLFALIEKSFEKHHLLYDALATGAAARNLLDGQFTAVMSIGGKITRLIDLDAMVGQFSHIESPAAALRATGIEEDVHAMVLQLSRKNPGKYGYDALVKKWKDLPAKLKQSVWQAYRAANQNTANADEAKLPSFLTQTQEWHLMNEFLRMLVQDSHFAGQITETVDADPSLVQWVKDLLKDLGNILRNLLKDAPPALQKDINSMVAEIGQQLSTIEARSTSTTSRLESLTSLRDPAATARQTLAALGATTPIFSPAALERIFNQMPAALQKQTFHQWQQSQPAEKPAKASKADLMRFLLGQMLADPSIATSTLLLAEKPATSLLTKVLEKLSTLTSGSSPTATTSPLRSLHVATLRALGGLHGMVFVQRLSPAQQQLYTAALTPAPAADPETPTAPTGRAADMLAALDSLEQDHQQASTPAAALRLREKLRQQEIAQNRALFFAQDNAARAHQQESPPDRGADMLAALQAHEDALALDHQQASTPVAAALLRTKLGLQRVARNRARFFLRDKAARELHAAEQAGRQDLPKAQSLLALALGHIGSRRAASGWRTLGIAERRQLALLGIGVDQHPHTETGGYPYSLSRIESAELRLEFSIAGTPEHQMAQEELDWMRQQPAEYQTALDPLSPAYVERYHVIIKQSALDDLSLTYPHTAALIRPELEARQSYGLRVDARSPQGAGLAKSHLDSGSGNSANSVNPVQTPESLAALRNALPPGTQRDILKPSPVETTLKDGPLPAATPQDTAALDRDFHESVAAGNALDASAPTVADLDLEDDIADSADAYLDGELLPAAQRNPASSIESPASRFYSALARAIEAKMPARSTPATVVGILKNAGIKTEELKWTGILPWLQQQAQNGPITQQQVLDYLANEGSVHLQEVRLGGSQTQLEDANRAVITQAKAEGMTRSGAEDYALSAARGDLSPGQLSFISPAMRPLVARLRASYEARAAEYAAGQSQPKYSQYQLPGGTNYREVVLSMPKEKQKSDLQEVERLRAFNPTLAEKTDAARSREYGWFEFINGLSPQDQNWVDRYIEAVSPDEEAELIGEQSDYTSSHFPDLPNYVAHMRLNDRTDAAGHPGTFIEEIQSDRHQAGREKGYREDKERELESLIQARDAGDVSAQDKINALGSQDVGVPDAPFRTSWPLQMFKRALADAVASGKQWIGWTTGETQAARYDLSKQISTLYAVPDSQGGFNLSAQDTSGTSHEIGRNISGEKLPEYVGKDLAHRILTAPAPNGIYTGTDLKVGGEGMRGFYDQILPKEIGKYVKQWGAGVQKGRIPSISDQYAGTPYASAIDQPGPEIWRVDITPQMRAGVEAGQALFAARRAPHPLALPRPGATLSPDEALRSPSHILASLYPGSDSALHAGADVRADRKQRGEPRPSVGGGPADTSRVLDWARKHRRFFSPRALQLKNFPGGEIFAGGEHVVYAHQFNSRLYKFTRLASKHQPSAGSSSEALAKEEGTLRSSTQESEGRALPASTRVAAAAAETDRNPTDAQKAAGNYPKGKVSLHGLRLSIENPRGSVRSGTDASGKPWSVTLPHHYGYFLGTEGKDGDHVDFFLGPNPDSQQVLIINQRKVRSSDVATPGRTSGSGSGSGNPASSIKNPASSAFDEHKVMLGFDSPIAAARAYLASYTPGWRGFGSAVPTTVPVLKEWLANHDTTKPVTRDGLAKVALAASQRTTQTPTMADSPQAAHSPEPSPGGLSEAEFTQLNEEYQDIRAKEKQNPGFWMAGPFWHVTNYTYSADSSYVTYRNVLGIEHQFRISNHEKPPGHATDRYFRLQYVGPENAQFRTEARKYIATKLRAAPDLNLQTINDVRREWLNEQLSTAVYELERAQETFAKINGRVAELEQRLERKKNALAQGIRIGNGKPFTTENQREQAAASIAETEVELEQERQESASKIAAAQATLSEKEKHLSDVRSLSETGKAAGRGQTGAGSAKTSKRSQGYTTPFRDGPEGSEFINPSPPEVNPESSRAEGGTLVSGSPSVIPLPLHSLAKNSGTESPILPASPRVESAAKALDKSVTGLGQAANLIPTAVGKVIQGVTGLGQHIPGHEAMSAFGTRLGAADAAAASAAGHAIASALQRVSGKDIRKAPDAVAAWLNKPDGLGSWTKNTVVDQLLPTALMPREWLALSHEMQRKTAFGAEKSNDLLRALSGNPRLSDLAYPEEFAKNPAYREQLFDAMENKIPWSSLPPAMQALGTKLRAMLRETGLELVKQGLMHPDTFEELQGNGWMPRYMLEEAMESGGSVLAAFKLGVKDLLQQRSTAFHIVDTTRKGKDGQYLTVNRQEKGRNAWRFRDAATRDAFYSDFIRRQALDMLQERHGNTKEIQTMMAPLDSQQRREVRAQIQLLTRADMDSTQKLSPALAGMVKAAIEHQKSIYRKEAPFDPPKLIKDPVYAIARYILAQTHNAATMELLNQTAKNKDWTSNVSLQGFTPIPDQTRFGPLAGKFVQKDIAQQILDKLDVPNAALRFYDAILRKWKSGKLVWNPGSHIRDAVGNTVFAYLGGSSIANPGNWPYYRQALEIMRNGGPLYAELLEHGVLGGDAYSSLVREKLKGLLPDAKTVEHFNPGLIQRFFFDFGSKFHATHEQLAEYRRMPDDFYKIAAYLKAKAEYSIQHPASSIEDRGKAAAAHVRKWFPYYDRLGGSGFMRIAGRAVNPFLSFFRESTRILATAAKERPIALAAALAFPAAITAISAMLLHLDDRDKDEIEKDLAGRGKGILGLSNLHLFSMLLPFRSSQGQVQQWDISAIMPFADLLGQKVVPLEEKENAWQTFWRQTAAAGPIGNLGVSWITNRDLFSGRHLTEADMSTGEMLRAYTQHAAGVALPPLAPDLAAAVGIGDGGALTKAGQRQVNKTLQTYDPVQTVIRSVFGMNVKSAAPNIYRQAEDFRKAHGYDAQPGFDYGTTITSRAKRLLVQELAQDTPNPRRITALATRLKALGVPLETSGDIAKVLKIIDPSQIMNGSKKSGLSAEQARQRFRQSLPPESRTLYEASLSEFERIKQKAPALLRQTPP